MINKKSSFYVFKQLWPFVKPYRKALFVSVIALVINASVEAVLISLTKPLLDNGLLGKDYALMVLIAFAIVGLIALRGFANYGSSYCLSWLSGKVVNKFRQLVFNHLIRSPVSFHDQKSIGELVSLVTYNTSVLSGASSGAMIVFVRELVYALGLFVVMFYGSWKLALVLIIVVPCVMFVAQFISKRIRNIIRTMQNNIGVVTATADEMLKGHKEILMFNASNYEKNKFYQISEKTRLDGLRIGLISGLSTPIIQLVAAAGLGAVLYLVARGVVDITPGSFTVVFSAMYAVMRPLRELTKLQVQLQSASIACESLFGFLNSPLEDDKGTIELDRAKGDIEFDNVTYTYPTRTAPALNQISFRIKAGETIAVVGRSGAGKSTIASLLPRFYDITEGEILIDSINIKNYTLKSLRNQIGYVSQRVHLFNSTIADNIAYGETNKYSREEIIRAATQANAMEFIETLEHGLDTDVGDNGVLLSGGQRQRIAIARALLRDNPILILDEATSALDNESERLVQKAIEQLQKNRTSIIIAHRLSTIEQADRILVIDDGKVIEQGDHNALIAQKGIYAQMHEMQFKSDN